MGTMCSRPGSARRAAAAAAPFDKRQPPAIGAAFGETCPIMTDYPARTPQEAAFLSALLARVPDLDVWLHETDDGHPWICFSLDFRWGNTRSDTLRLDFQESSILGGWSPWHSHSEFEWANELQHSLQARDAGVDTSPPDGIELSEQPPEVLAETAAKWFQRHRETYSR